MPLSETQIRNLKPATTPKKHFDGEGLFLYVTPAGSKLWRMAGSTSKKGAKGISGRPFRRGFYQPIRKGRGHASGSFQNSGSRTLVAG